MCYTPTYYEKVKDLDLDEVPMHRTGHLYANAFESLFDVKLAGWPTEAGDDDSDIAE